MNHKEALQEVEDIESEAKQLAEEEYLPYQDMGKGRVDLNTGLKREGFIRGYTLAAQSKSGYSEADVCEYVKWRMGVMRPNGKAIVRQAIADNVDPEPLVFKYWQSLQPKTEEVERGWTITDKTLIDRQLEAIKTVMSNIKTKEQAIQFLKDAGIELEEEQPTPPSIEKKLQTALYKFIREKHNQDECIGFIKGFKANNSLEELEKWVKDYGITNHVHREDLLNKIQELKNLKP